MEPSDEALVLRCRTGDAAAWEMLILRYQRLIYSIPRRAGLDEELAADVFQRVCELLLHHLPQLEQPNRIGAWLATTARRESWRVSRRQRVALPSLDDALATDEATQIPDQAPLPDEVLLRLEEQHRVRLALGALDERCRQLLELLFAQPEAPSYGEIAAVLGTSEGSIGPTRARCLQKLRRLLEDEAP